jgi:hypothetical protein
VTADSGAGAKAPEGEDEIARLLAVPLGDFVEERKRLAASLKSLGRRDEAQAIAKLAKPSAALWAINQLARREPAAIRRLGELTAVMQAGPRHAPDEYAQRLAEHRDVLRALRAAAEGILAEAKVGVSPALLERILHSLRAGMADDETRAAIEKARLLAEVGELDFTSLLGAQPAGVGVAPRAPAARPAPRTETPTTQQTPHGRTAGDEQQEEKARAHEAAARAREEEQERARARAAAAREAEQLRAKADAIRRRVRDDERAVEAARRALIEAEERLDKARLESEQLERALKAAQAAARGQSD